MGRAFDCSECFTRKLFASVTAAFRHNEEEASFTMRGSPKVESDDSSVKGKAVLGLYASPANDGSCDCIRETTRGSVVLDFVHCGRLSLCNCGY